MNIIVYGFFALTSTLLFSIPRNPQAFPEFKQLYLKLLDLRKTRIQQLIYILINTYIRKVEEFKKRYTPLKITEPDKLKTIGISLYRITTNPDSTYDVIPQKGEAKPYRNHYHAWNLLAH